MKQITIKLHVYDPIEICLEQLSRHTHAAVVAVCLTSAKVQSLF